MKKTIALVMTAVMALATPASVLAEEWDDVIISEEPYEEPEEYVAPEEPAAEINDDSFASEIIIDDEIQEIEEEPLPEEAQIKESDVEIVIESIEEVNLVEAEQVETDAELYAQEPYAIQPLSAVLNSTDVTIYSLSSWESDYISIPDEYPQSFEILVDGKPSDLTWKSDNKNIAYVDEDGVIRSGGNLNYTTKLTTTYEEQTLEIQVTVLDYGDIYVEQVVDAYLSNNITDAMSTYDKVVKICEFVCSYDYSASYSSMKGMIISGGGDCWSSTSTVNYMCGQLGIPAGNRNSARWDGAVGSGHRNSYVNIDGEIYVVDCGYTGTAPRYYDFYKISQIFKYTENDDGTLTIYHYEGYDEIVEIPSEIDGKTVTALGDYSFAEHSEIKEVIIPDSVTSIGVQVFESCSNLTDISLSDNVVNIGIGAFWSCSSLESIALPSNLSCLEGYVFELCSSLKRVTIPDSVTTIGEYAFAHCEALEEVQGMQGVTAIEDYAFYICKNLNAFTLPDGLVSIGDYVFQQCYGIETLTIPEGVISIGDYAFFSVSSMTDISFPSSVLSIGENALYSTSSLETISVAEENPNYIAVDGVLYNKDFSELICCPSAKTGEYIVPASVEAVDAYAFQETSLERIFFIGDAPVFNIYTFYSASTKVFYPGSKNKTWTEDVMQSYYGKNITWLSSSLADATFSMSGNFTYSGEEKKATVNVYAGISSKTVLQRDVDYTIEYYNNINAGTATFTVTGIGNFTDSLSADYQIQPLNVSKVKISLSQTSYTYDGESKVPKISATYNNSSSTLELEEGKDYTVKYSNNKNAGTATATITGKGNYTGEVQKNYTIYKAYQRVTASAAASSIKVGEKTKITVTGEGTITYSSSNTSVAKVSSNGAVTGKGAGTAWITATADGGDNYRSGSAMVRIVVKADDSDSAGSGNSGTGSSVILKSGSSYTVGDFKYKITSLPASGTGAVTITAPAKASIKTATIPAKVTIGGRSFKVTKIGAKAFKGCTKLKTVTVGKNVTTIGNQAFQGCTKMTGISIKTGVTTIGKKAFYNCKNLKTITIKSKKLTSVGKNAFKGIKSNAKIKVPSSKLKAYIKLLKGKGQGSKVKITS